MENSSKETKSAEEQSEDLDNLLDSALGDFDKPLPKAPLSTNDKKVGESSKKDSAEWGNEFTQFQDAMTHILNNDRLQDVLNMGGLNLDSDSSAGASGCDFAVSLADTLKAISDSAQSFNEPSSDELAQLFKTMGMEEGADVKLDQLPDMMPIMENVMQSLLSKELLYPALKDIVNKYPDWLAENQPTLEENLFQKYSLQYELMKQVCTEFENQDTVAEGEKSRSFPKILSLMQKMQECGNPPKELVGDVPHESPFDEDGNMKLPGMPDQCNIM